jgi:hypothetical protein
VGCRAARPPSPRRLPCAASAFAPAKRPSNAPGQFGSVPSQGCHSAKVTSEPTASNGEAGGLLHSMRPQKKPRRSGADFDQARLDNGLNPACWACARSAIPSRGVSLSASHSRQAHSWSLCHTSGRLPQRRGRVRPGEKNGAWPVTGHRKRTDSVWVLRLHHSARTRLSPSHRRGLRSRPLGCPNEKPRRSGAELAYQRATCASTPRIPSSALPVTPRDCRCAGCRESAAPRTNGWSHL